jgi:hypothetical protein
MKKLVLLAIVFVILVCVFVSNYHHDYKKDIGYEQRDTGRCATIKLKSGHVIMYYVDVDTGYFADAPECSVCSIERRNQFIADSLKKAKKMQQKRLDTIIKKEPSDTLI